MLLAGVFSGQLNAALGREVVATLPEGEGAPGQRRQQHRPLPRLRGGRHRCRRHRGGEEGTGLQGLVEGWNRAALVTVLVSVVGGLVAFLLHEPRRSAPAHADEPAGLRVAPVPD
jgi:hypothetical protein